ncbi:MAG TPA: flagellar filament capping protein FliD, partial [Acidobacteriota bacterium]|nr:flagellar filament capping protein FliD [Acidobacteriota bacterium]
MASTSSTSSSTGTGSVNFSTGLASGIDWSAVTDALIKADSYPLTKLQNDVSNYTTQKNVFNALSSSLQTFESKLKAIKDSTSFGGKTTSISDLPSGSVTPFTATIGSGASSGDVKIRVEKLAAAQRVRSNGVSDAYAPLVADGQISIKSGTNDAITIDVSSANGNNSLQAIADTINAADKGVAASIVSDGTNQLLVVKSTATGAANALTISDTTNLGLADSANNLQDAADAVVWVDGIRVTSATNSVSGAMAGVTLNLSATTDAEVTLHVADDVAGTKQSLQDLVDAYNSVNDLFQSQ